MSTLLAVRPLPLHAIKIGDRVSEPVVLGEVDYTKFNEFVVRFVYLHHYFNNIGTDGVLSCSERVSKGPERH